MATKVTTGILAALAVGAGYLAFREYKAAQAAEVERVRVEAELAEERLRCELGHEGQEGLGLVDTIRKAALDWLLVHLHDLKLSDVADFLSQIDGKFIPIVIDEWRANGMSLDFLIQVVKKFLPGGSS